MGKNFRMGFAFACVLSSCVSVNAGTLSLGLDTVFSGDTPAGSSPWINATFDDSFGGPNTVRLTMTTNNLAANEFVSDWYFNFDPTLNASLLTFAVVGTPGSTPTSINKSNDAYKADGDGFHDIRFEFPTSGSGSGSLRFTKNETVVYDLTYTSPISVSSFNFIDNGGNKGDFRTAAHVQGIDLPNSNNAGSSWIGTGPSTGVVPMPSTFAMTLSMLGGFTCFGMFRSKFGSKAS